MEIYDMSRHTNRLRFSFVLLRFMPKGLTICKLTVTLSNEATVETTLASIPTKER